MKSILEEKFPKDSTNIEIFVPETNAGFLSLDGVQVGALRILKEFEDFILERFNQDDVIFTQLSIVGYSLGGLCARYLVGLLNREGFFNHTEPVTFTTFATPHLGSNFLKRTILSKTLNFLGSNVLGISGHDLFHSGSNILEDMADPEQEYYQGLKKFKHLMLFSNATNDRTVPFYTSFIADRNPFEEAGLVDEVYFELPPLEPGSLSSSSLQSVSDSKSKVVEQPDSSSNITNDFTVESNYIDVPMFIDMNKSRFKASKPKLAPSSEEKRFTRYLTIALPFALPILLTVSTVATALSHVRAHEFAASEKSSRIGSALEIYNNTTNQFSSPDKSQEREYGRKKQICDEQHDHDEHNEPINVEEHHVVEHHMVSDMTAEVMDDMLFISSEGRSENVQDNSIMPIAKSTQIRPILRDGYEGLLESTTESLNLTIEQRRILESLNKLPWEKFVVKIQRLHSHAEIINRRNKPGQGSRILSFWANYLTTKFDASVNLE